MALKHKITSSEFETLSDELKKEYKIQADMSYQLDLGQGVYVTDRDPTGLMSALEAEREETRKAKAAADRLEAEKKAAEMAKITDVEELKKHFDNELKEIQKKAEAERREAEKQRVAQQQQAAEQVRKQRALEVASELFGSHAPIMLPHVEAQLKAVPGESPKVEIIDPASGQPSIDQSLENWKKSLSTNPLYSPMVVVSRASGGSANGGQSTGLPASTTNDGKPKTYADYKPAELLAIKREQPDVFQQLKSQKG